MKVNFDVKTMTVTEFLSSDDEVSNLKIDCQGIGQTDYLLDEDTV